MSKVERSFLGLLGRPFGKAFWGLFGPFQGLAKYGRPLEGFPKGWEGIPVGMEGILKAFEGILGSFGGRTGHLGHLGHVRVSRNCLMSSWTIYGHEKKNGRGVPKNRDVDGEIWNDTTAVPWMRMWIAEGGRRLDGASGYATQAWCAARKRLKFTYFGAFLSIC